MAVLAIFNGIGVTKDTYEAIRKEVGWETQQAAGSIIHVADVWASAEAMDDFVSTRLMPAMQKLNVPPPQVDVYPVYNVNVYAAADQYKMK